jgi:hypothetical protein
MYITLQALVWTDSQISHPCVLFADDIRTGGVCYPGWARPEDAQSPLAPPAAGPRLAGADTLRYQAGRFAH